MVYREFLDVLVGLDHPVCYHIDSVVDTNSTAVNQILDDFADSSGDVPETRCDLLKKNENVKKHVPTFSAASCKWRN